MAGAYKSIKYFLLNFIVYKQSSTISIRSDNNGNCNQKTRSIRCQKARGICREKACGFRGEKTRCESNGEKSGDENRREKSSGEKARRDRQENHHGCEKTRRQENRKGCCEEARREKSPGEKTCFLRREEARFFREKEIRNFLLQNKMKRRFFESGVFLCAPGFPRHTLHIPYILPCSCLFSLSLSLSSFSLSPALPPPFFFPLSPIPLSATLNFIPPISIPLPAIPDFQFRHARFPIPSFLISSSVIADFPFCHSRLPFLSFPRRRESTPRPPHMLAPASIFLQKIDLYKFETGVSKHRIEMQAVCIKRH